MPTEDKQTGKNFYIIDDADKYAEAPQGPYNRTDARRLCTQMQKIISRAQLRAMQQQKAIDAGDPPQQPLPHRIIKIDALIKEVSQAGDNAAPTDMIWMKEAKIDGLTRTYYAGAGPARVLLVLRNGITLYDLNRHAGIDTYGKALLGWDRGETGYVRPENENRQHTKITIDQVYIMPLQEAAEIAAMTGRPIEPLTEILANAPRADKRGGARGGAGRPAIALGENVTIALEAWQARKFEEIGSGNIAAGIRMIADQLWPEEARKQ